MERNEGMNDLGAGAGQSDGTLSGSGAASGDTNFDFGSSPEGGQSSGGIADRAKSAAGTAGEKLSGMGSTLRDRAGSAKDKLADVLESGAGRLRERAGGTATLAGATDAGSVAMTDGRASQVAERVAGGMQSSADWLRDADLDSLKATVEQQVKEHPGRTLLIAAGLGYLVGRAFRNQ